MEYVVGFLFHPQRQAVALIRKNKPEWQKGLLNGVGGKIEPGENPVEAMTREFTEEAGITLTRWRLFRTEKFSSGTVVHFFSAVSRLSEWDSIKSKTDEEIVLWRGDIRDEQLIYNLRYLIPMAEVLLAQSPEFVPLP